MAVKIIKESIRWLLACGDKDDKVHIISGPFDVYSSEAEAQRAWAYDPRFKRKTSQFLIGDRDVKYIRSLFWGELKSLWKLLKGSAPIPRDLDSISISLAEEIRSREPAALTLPAVRRLSRTAQETTSDPNPVEGYRGKAPKRSGGGGKGGSELIKRFAEEKNLEPSKVRALLRKAGLSAPYTDEAACRKALGL